MKTKDKKDLFTKNVGELKNQLLESRKELARIRLEFSRQKIKNSKELFWARKKIAIILTILKEKESNL